ncbi:MAG: hypothetical protein KFW07_00815, partial [Mycoplasmataceae bacterium]|nr:hypothetical protein [Mycoplasmataceae bacterium]
YNPFVTPGGIFLPYAASTRIQLKKIKAVNSGTVQVGAIIRGKVIKNKISHPGRAFEVPITFGKGFDKKTELVMQALTTKVLWKANFKAKIIFYKTEDDPGFRKFNGIGKVNEVLETDIDFYNALTLDIDTWLEKNKYNSNVDLSMKEEDLSQVMNSDDGDDDTQGITIVEPVVDEIDFIDEIKVEELSLLDMPNLPKELADIFITNNIKTYREALDVNDDEYAEFGFTITQIEKLNDIFI